LGWTGIGWRIRRRSGLGQARAALPQRAAHHQRVLRRLAATRVVGGAHRVVARWRDVTDHRSTPTFVHHGGGTFDVSLPTIEESVIEGKAKEGDTPRRHA